MVFAAVSLLNCWSRGMGYCEGGPSEVIYLISSGGRDLVVVHSCVGMYP